MKFCYLQKIKKLLANSGITYEQKFKFFKRRMPKHVPFTTNKIKTGNGLRRIK